MITFSSIEDALKVQSGDLFWVKLPEPYGEYVPAEVLDYKTQEFGEHAGEVGYEIKLCSGTYCVNVYKKDLFVKRIR